MNDLIFVTAHCPTEEHEKMLERCLNSISETNKDILLISHTHVPIHLQKKCKYYFYDHFNDINHEDDLLYFVRYLIDDRSTIRSKYFTKEFYGFAIYRMFTIASQISINFGYQNLHHIEYDCELRDLKLIEEHSKILESYDSVLYTDTGDLQGFLFAAIKSFKVNKLPELFKNYDKEKIRTMMVQTPLVPLENFTKHIFNVGGNVFFRNSKEIRETGRFIQYESPLRLKYFTPYFDETKNKFFLFYKNISNEIDHLKLFVNGKELINLKINIGYWRIQELCNSEDLRSLLIISKNKIIYDKEFTQIEREQLKQNAYLIINEKNN